MSGKSTAEKTPPGLPAVLKQLSDRTTQLNQLDDRIAKAISILEHALRKHLSVRVHQVISQHSTDFGSSDRLEVLTFGKHRGKWQLLIEWGTADLDRNFTADDDGSTPLLNCARDKRAAVFEGGHIEHLIRAAFVQCEEEIASRQKAVAIADRLLADLGATDLEPPSATADDDIPF